MPSHLYTKRTKTKTVYRLTTPWRSSSCHFWRVCDYMPVTSTESDCLFNSLYRSNCLLQCRWVSSFQGIKSGLRRYGYITARYPTALPPAYRQGGRTRTFDLRLPKRSNLHLQCRFLLRIDGQIWKQRSAAPSGVAGFEPAHSLCTKQKNHPMQLFPTVPSRSIRNNYIVAHLH